HRPRGAGPGRDPPDRLPPARAVQPVAQAAAEDPPARHATEAGHDVNPFGPILAGLIEGAIFLALVGIIVRGRVRYCWSFTGYLATVFTGDLLVIAWPNIFFTPEAWMVRQSVYGALKMG